MKKAGLLLTGLSLLLLLFPFSCLAAEAAGNIGTMLPIWSILPFAGILLSIALMPLFVPHFWHYHFPKVSAFWAVSFAVPFLYFFREIAVHEIAHIIIIDYIPFIPVSYTHLRAHETPEHLVCRLLLAQKHRGDPSTPPNRPSAVRSCPHAPAAESMR